MEHSKCPNYDSCKLINSTDVVNTQEERDHYIRNYCITEEQVWYECKRYQIKAELDFCPDFVLPDNVLTTEEIMERFDNDIFDID
ncbi:MAG: hypothetical protein K9I94_11050 [Bacteroidales bacterium]|nr:hypothetical protein [Bacteroidales bacterium]